MPKHSWTETFYYLTLIAILNCGIDILSVSDPDLEIRAGWGGGGCPDPEIGGAVSQFGLKGGLGPSTGSATASIL